MKHVGSTMFCAVCHRRLPYPFQQVSPRFSAENLRAPRPMDQQFPASRRTLLPIATFAAFVLPSMASAAESNATINTGDTAWILASTALVLFMTIPSLALFYGGLVRTKNVLSVLMHCLVLTALMSVLWVVCGYSLAFGPETEGAGRFIGGTEHVMMNGIDASSVYVTSGDSEPAVGIPMILFAAFQMTFAVITPALMVGAFCERMKFSAMLLFCAIWLFVVYVPIAHMTWGGGLYAQWGVMDFAGGIVVHVTAGFGALVACLVVGSRAGHPHELEPPHNLTMTVTGTGMLWVGWFGFNAGSALGANGDAAMALFVTHLSASVATLVWMSIEWVKNGKPSVLGAATGSIAGLAAITPASGYVGPLGALVIGTASAVICFLFATAIKHKFRYDDTLDVFGVHGVGGFLGTILCGIFAAPALGGKVAEHDIVSGLTTQTIGAVSAAIYTIIATVVILKLVQAVVGLRVDVNQEIRGLDLSEHEERGYIFY